MILESLRVVFMRVVTALLFHEDLEPLVELVSRLVEVFRLTLSGLPNVSAVVTLAL